MSDSEKGSSRSPNEATESTLLTRALPIEHNVVLDMLRITMLVYNYGKNIRMDNEEDTNIETFVGNLKAKGEFSQIDMNDTRKKALEEVAEHAPNGKICCFIDDEHTDVQAGVTLSTMNKRISIVFRGSESRSDWYYDLMVTKHQLSDDVYVHKGFHAQLTERGTYDKLKFHVQQLLEKYPDYNVYVTGHSLGGALSTLFGYMIAHEVNANVTVCSFASPRVGNYKWKESFDAKENLTHYRVSNQRDVITAFPLYRYHHTGENLQLTDTSFLTFAKDAIRGWFDETPFTCWSVSEHDCDLYYKRLCFNKW
jgi:hypothetical protein